MRFVTVFSFIAAISFFVLPVSAMAQSAPGNESSIFADVRVIAALVAAAVTVLVNIFGKPFIDRWLESWKTELAVKKAEAEARIGYEFEAKKRLYTAIGPLRFQLLLACRDAARHVKSHSGGQRDFPVTVNNYYGVSTLHKIIRPIALLELIEEQIMYADFAVESEAIELIKCKQSIYAAFSSGKTVHGHPDANWDDEEQHIFYHSISRIANALVIPADSGGKRVMRFDEFEEFLKSAENVARVSPLPYLYEDFTFRKKPLFAARLVLYGYVCAKYVNNYGVPIGFEKIDYSVPELLKNIDDEYINGRLDDFSVQFGKTASMGV